MSPCSNPERRRIQGTEPVAEAASQCRADAARAVDSLSAQGMRVQELSTTLHLHEEYVRQLVRQ